ncbi:MAG: hypothetical protein ACYSUI_13430 [Planctomycetota bacterium]
MTGQPPDHMQPPAPMPPTQPGEMYRPEQPSNWPKVVGIIGIVLGALAILGGCWGAVSPFVVTALQDAVETAAPQGQPSPLAGLEIMQQHKAWTIGSQLVAMALATLLLFVGLGLVRRRRRSVSAATYWAVLKLLFAVVYPILSYRVMKPAMDEVVQQTSTVPGMGGTLFEGIMWLSVVFSILWYSAFPVFLLIWLNRSKIKAEVADWS